MYAEKMTFWYEFNNEIGQINVAQNTLSAGSVMASSAAPADSQARVGPSAEAEHFVDFPIT